MNQVFVVKWYNTTANSALVVYVGTYIYFKVISNEILYFNPLLDVSVLKNWWHTAQCDGRIQKKNEKMMIA